MRPKYPTPVGVDPAGYLGTLKKWIDVYLHKETGHYYIFVKFGPSDDGSCTRLHSVPHLSCLKKWKVQVYATGKFKNVLPGVRDLLERNPQVLMRLTLTY